MTEKYNCNKKFMQKAIELALLGVGAADPNPYVGAVIVQGDRIVAKGWHRRFGELHAERNALLDAAKRNIDVKGADMYVTLEPCCHHGKTPPCTEAIIEAGIKRVIIGSRDPNPKVHGKGAKSLSEAGIEVVWDFLKDECDAINQRFLHYITTGMPYVMLKYAVTADGKIATHTKASKYISCEASRQRVMDFRNEYMAIMVGIGTVLQDDPMLTCRIEGGRDPIRIIADSNIRLPVDCRLADTAKDIETFVACCVPDAKDGELEPEHVSDSSIRRRIIELKCKGVKIINAVGADNKTNLKKLMNILGKKGISGVMIEGGSGLNWSALESEIVQEINIFVASKIFGGKDAPSPVGGMGVAHPDDAIKLKLMKAEISGDDILLRYTL